MTEDIIDKHAFLARSNKSGIIILCTKTRMYVTDIVPEVFYYVYSKSLKRNENKVKIDDENIQCGSTKVKYTNSVELYSND